MICALRNHEIRLSFSGVQPEECTILWQYVPVEPARQYQLKFGMRTIDATKLDGLGWSVQQLEGTELGHGLAPADQLRFDSRQNNLVKLALVFRRPLGSARIQGSVAVTSLSMEPLP